jgi:thiol-disulfide isomerase/thioredoxin
VNVPSDAERLRTRLSRAFAGIAAVLLVTLLLFGLAASEGEPESSIAPAFDLELLDGGRVTNETLLGRAAVVNVWASWCPPCREEAPILRRVSEDSDPERVAFLGVIRNDDEDDARRFVADHDLAYPNAIGTDSFAGDFGVRGLPMTFVIGPSGRIVARHFGPISESRLVAMIEDALARAEPAAGSEP